MHTRRIATLALLATSCFSPKVPEDTEAGTGDPTTGETSGPSSGPSTETSGPTTTDPSGSGTTSGPTTTDTDPTEDTTVTDTDPTEGDTSSSGTGDPEVCGNGEVEGDEVCDDGTNDGSYGGCAEDCSALGPFCGDGEENGTEDCDDGDEVVGNGCNNDCVPSGLEQWTYEEHVTPEDLCVDIVAAEAGHVYLAAQVDNLDGADDADAFYVQRLSADGNVDWTREYAPLADADEHDYDVFGATVGADGVVVVGAHRTNVAAFATYTDVPTALFSEDNGDVVWDRSDGFADFAAGVVTDDDGAFVVAATTVNDFDVYLYRVSAAGDLMGSTDVDAGRRARALAFDPAGSFVVASELDAAPTDAVLQRRNQGFGALWEVTPNGLRSPLGVAVDGDGRVYSVGSGSASQGPWVGGFASNGADDWTVYVDTVAALGDPEDIVTTDDGGLAVVGTRSGAPFIARLDTDGNVMWSRSADEVGRFNAVAVTAAGSFVACGTINGGGQGDNIFVAEYSP